MTNCLVLACLHTTLLDFGSKPAQKSRDIFCMQHQHKWLPLDAAVSRSIKTTGTSVSVEPFPSLSSFNYSV